MAAPRGCGFRKPGGIYLVCGTSPLGEPIENFLIDPPIKLSPAEIQAIGLSPVGVSLIEQDGVTHVLDWVGSEHYPNVADFVEEARRQGVSRRAASTVDFSRLGPESRLMLVHQKAWIRNFRDYYERTDWACPKRLAAHSMERIPVTVNGDNLIHRDEMCAGLWWRDVVGGVPYHEHSGQEDLDNPFEVFRQMPSFGYRAHHRPPMVDPIYSPAIFASFPIRTIEVIAAADGSHEAAAEKARAAKVEVRIEEE